MSIAYIVLGIFAYFFIGKQVRKISKRCEARMVLIGEWEAAQGWGIAVRLAYFWPLIPPLTVVGGILTLIDYVKRKFLK